MNINQFVSKYSGQKVDFDGAYGAQCTDIVKFWEQNIGSPITHGNAIAYPLNADGINYLWVKNLPWNSPKPGDIVVFNLGTYGHIGICVSAGIWKLTVFEQNNPLGSACHLRDYNYISPRVLGWLHPTKLG